MSLKVNKLQKQFRMWLMKWMKFPRAGYAEGTTTDCGSHYLLSKPGSEDICPQWLISCYSNDVHFWALFLWSLFLSHFLSGSASTSVMESSLEKLCYWQLSCPHDCTGMEWLILLVYFSGTCRHNLFQLQSPTVLCGRRVSCFWRYQLLWLSVVIKNSYTGDQPLARVYQHRLGAL